MRVDRRELIWIISFHALDYVLSNDIRNEQSKN